MAIILESILQVSYFKNQVREHAFLMLEPVVIPLIQTVFLACGLSDWLF